MGLIQGLCLGVDAPFFGGFRVEVLVLDDVGKEEDHVIGGERLAIGPFVALAQFKGDLGEVVIPFPGTGDIGDNGLEIVGHAHQDGLAPTQDVGCARGGSARCALDRSAVVAAAFIGEDNERLLRKAISHRRQCAGTHFGGKERIVMIGERKAGGLFDFRLLGECGGKPHGVGDRRTGGGPCRGDRKRAAKSSSENQCRRAANPEPKHIQHR